MNDILWSLASSFLGGMASKAGEKFVDYLTTALPAEDLSQIVGSYQSGVSSDQTAALLAEKLQAHLMTHTREHLGWTILGHALEQLDRNTEARFAYTKAIHVNPDSFQALVGLGILLRKERRYAEAMAHYRKATAIDPSYAQAWSSMCVIAMKQRNDSAALEYAQRGYSLNPQDAVIASNLAIAYHYTGNYLMRDKLTREAVRLGYKRESTLQAIYRGEMTVRDAG